MLMIVLAAAVVLFATMDISKFLNADSHNDTIDVTPLPTPDPTADVDVTSTPTPVDNDVPAPSRSVLYDTFITENPNWTSRSNSWSTDFVNVHFVPSHVWISDGDLHLRAYVDNNTGSEYKSDDSFLYGKYRASIRLEQTPGTYMSIFSYQWPTGSNRQGHNEIDIEFTKDGDKTQAIFTNYVNGIKDHSDIILPFDPSAAYHTYGYNWYPDRVEYFVDDMSKPVWVSHKSVPQGRMYLYFQVWTMRNVPSGHGNGVNTEYVDWVSVEPI